MSERLLTQAELDSYLNTLNLDDPSVVRVLNGIQLLTPDLYNEILYYLVIGKVSVNDLDNVPINNFSIKNFVDSLGAGNTGTTLEKKRKYEEFIKTLPGYQTLLQDSSVASSHFLYQSMYPSSEIVLEIDVDASGIGDADSFRSITEVRSKYRRLLQDYRTKASWIDLQDYSSSMGAERIFRIFSEELDAYRLIRTTDDKIIYRIDPSETILGYAIRNLHMYLWRKEILSNIAYILDKMVENYDLDPARNGAVGVRSAMEANKWTDICLPTNDAKSAIASFVRATFVRYGMPNAYGTPFFTTAELDAEYREMDKYLTLFKKISAVAVEFRTILKEQLVP